MNNLFDNPMVESARRAMSRDQIDEYKRMGEYMYNSVDFTAEEYDHHDPLMSSVEYIMAGIKSGLCPSDLDDEEVGVLKTVYGEEWWVAIGFIKDESGEFTPYK